MTLVAHESANNWAPAVDVKHFSLMTRDWMRVDAACLELTDIAIVNARLIARIPRIDLNFIFFVST